MKKSLKLTKNSTQSAKAPTKTRDSDLPKSAIWIDQYDDCFGMKGKPITEAFLERFSTELVTWAKTDPKALKVTQFHLDKGIYPATYYDWVNKYPIIKQAHEYAKAIIGNRREVGALEKKYDSSMVSYMMPYYDPSWKAETERRAKLKSESEENSGTKIVIMDSFSAKKESDE